MNEFIQFEATTPVVVPAKSEEVYDKYWIVNFNVDARNPIRPVTLTVDFAPAKQLNKEIPRVDKEGKPVLDENGTPIVDKIEYKELQPGGRCKRLVLNDLFGQASTNPEMGALMNQLFTFIKTIAESQKIL
jgi:hypothetical protein